MLSDLLPKLTALLKPWTDAWPELIIETVIAHSDDEEFMEELVDSSLVEYARDRWPTEAQDFQVALAANKDARDVLRQAVINLVSDRFKSMILKAGREASLEVKATVGKIVADKISQLRGKFNGK